MKFTVFTLLLLMASLSANESTQVYVERYQKALKQDQSKLAKYTQNQQQALTDFLKQRDQVITELKQLKSI